MKWIAIAVGVLVLLVLVVVIVGYVQPVKHRAVRQATYHATAPHLYDLITQVGTASTWRSTKDEVPFVIVERVPSQRVVTRISDPNLPFGGSWTYELTPADSGRTTLRITEDGEVYNPVFRFVSRFIMGHTATIDQYLRDLGRHLKEEPAIS